MEHIDSRPDRDPIRALPLWQAVSLCVGLVLLALPLVVLPGVVVTHLRGEYPEAGSIATAVVGVLLSLATFRVLAPALGLSLADVFVGWPDRSAAGWGVAGLLIAGTITIGATAIAGGSPTSAGVDARTGTTILVGAAVVALWPAVLEEFLVRGYLLGVIGRRWNWRAAIAITASVFALLHHGHATDAWSLALYLATTGVAGVLFALVTLSTENVWNAVALHTAWNTAFSGDVLAFRPPAEAGTAALVTIELRNLHPLLGGNGVGIPESPLAALVLLAAVGVVIVTDRRSVER